MNKNIEPRNTKGELHGYIEIYFNNDVLWLRGYFKNNKDDGYQERYSVRYLNKPNNKIATLSFYIL